MGWLWLACSPNQVEGVDAKICVGYGPAKFPFRGREVDFTKWVGWGLAGFSNRVEGVDALIRVGYGPPEFLFRGR